MVLSLSNLHTYTKGRRKRVGRGNASGHGTFSTRGQKGQRARTGGRKNLRRRGLKQFLQQIPKLRGFKSFHVKYQLVTIDALQHKFDNGEVVDVRKMATAGLCRVGQPVKVLAAGKVTKKLTVIAHTFSAQAREAITGAGGTATTIVLPVRGKKKKQ